MDLRDLSIRELRLKLQEAMADVAAAEKEFQQAKVQANLNYKKIAPKGLSNNFTSIKFDQSDVAIKNELIAKIKTAQAKAKQIRSMAANLDKLSYKDFSDTYEENLSLSKQVQILKNLGADEEAIDAILSECRGDEDYEELKDMYNDYQINKLIEEGAQVIPREEALDFLSHRQQ